MTVEDDLVRIALAARQLSAPRSVNPYDDVLRTIELGVRKVRTTQGEKVFGQPIGSVITDDGMRSTREGTPDGHKKVAELDALEKAGKGDTNEAEIAVAGKTYKVPKGSETYEYESTAAGKVVVAKHPDGTYHIYTATKEYTATNIDDAMIKGELARKSIIKTNLKKHEAYDDKKDPSVQRKVDIGGAQVTEHQLQAAIQALETASGSSVLGPLKRIDSPLAKLDYRALLADADKSSHPSGQRTRLALIEFLKSKSKAKAK